MNVLIKKMLTFQHIGTARHRGKNNTIDVMLYGRQADGTSTAIRVLGIRAYGFTTNTVNQQTVREWVQWVTAMQRTEGKCKRYKKDKDQDMPDDDILSFFQWCWKTSQINSSDIVWSRCSGYNIRHVEDDAPPVVWQFTVKRYDIWRALLTIFKDHSGMYERIRKFRVKMVSRVPEKILSVVDSMPCRLKLGTVELYETMFQPEIVWMVDHQLPACSWMNVSNYSPANPMFTE